ncbi:MAG TPA: c-type cytochrome [Guyparkeria sp.]|nr:c-type cytochrome [Guyparkeria sp.]
MAQHTPKVDPTSKLIGFLSALVVLLAVLYLVSTLINTIKDNSLKGQIVENPTSQVASEAAKAEPADEQASQAEAGTEAAPDSAAGDIAAGEQKFASCAACHGADGKGHGGAFPALTGLDAVSVQKAMTAYREGDREYLKSIGMGDRFGTMAPNAANLSDEDIADLAAYIGDAFGGGAGGDSSAAVDSDSDSNGGAVDGDVAAGEKVYTTCAACHGADGKGHGGAFPALTGLDAAQSQKALIAYREGDQEYLKTIGMGDRYGTMAPNAANLSDEDIANVSVYIAESFGGGNNSDGGNAAEDDQAANSETPPPAQSLIMDESVVKHGQAIYSNCSICHGEDGAGNALFSAPKLAGMSMDQAESLMKIYRKGQEMGPNSYAMIPQAKHLTDEDIKGVAAYIATLATGTE